MSGNSTSLYSTSSSNITLSSNNLTTLYPGSSGTVTPQQPYGNANVVSLLAVGTDGANTVGNISSSGIISATGNIVTDNYFIGTFLGNISGNLTVPGANTQVLFNNDGNAGASSGLTFNTNGNTLTVANTVVAGNVSTPTVYSQGMQTQGYDYVQMQYSNSVTLPVTPYDIGTGSWFYLDPGGGVFQSNTTGTLQTVVLGNDGTVSATGNVTAPYFIGNGSQLTGIATSTYSNANVSNFLANGFGSNTISTTGNISGGYFLGNGSQLTGLPATYGNANVVANLAALGSNPVSTTGNVTAGYFIGNGALLTSINASNIVGAYGNAQVASFLNAFGSNSISTTGNITSSYINGNGSLLTSITGGNVTGTVANATYALNANAATYASVATFADTANAVAGANVSGTVANATYALTSGSAGTANTAQYVTANAQSNITSVGTLTSVSVSGNTTTGNMLTAGVVSATGNITGAYILGNGSQLTGLPATYSNADVSNFLANGFGSNTISTTGNISAGNVLLGDLLGAGNVTATGNVTGANIIGNGSGLSSITGANVTGTVANATYATNAGSADTANTAQYVTANAQANITSVGTLTSLSVSGNTTSGNLLTAGVVSASGNITGSYILGNGSQLTGLPATYSNANVSNFLANGFGSNTITTTGNITAGYFVGNGSQLTGIVSSYGNANVVANLAALGTNPVSTTGNVTASYFIGNGALLTSINASNIVGAYGNANVSNFLANGFGSNTIVSTGNITGGNLLTGGASGNITGVNYVNANYFVGNGALLTGVANLVQIQNGTSNVSIPTTNGPANVVIAGTVRASFNSSGLAVTGTISSTGNIDGGNITSAADITAIGNIAGTNLNLSGGITATGSSLTIGTISATGNIRTSGGYFLGDGGFLSNVAAGASIQNGTSNVVAYSNSNIAVSVGGTSNVTVFSTTGQFVTGVVSASGNITGAAHLGGIVSATGNITTGQSTIIGTANTTGGAGNIILSGKNIATDMIRNPDSSTGTTADLARIVIGTGYAGNVSPGVAVQNGSTQGSRLLIGDSFARGNNALQSRALVINDYVTLSANVNNGFWRVNGALIQPIIGGGSAANTVVNTGTFGITALGVSPVIGGGLTGNLTALGNTTVQHATGMFSGVTVNPGSNIGNVVNIVTLTNISSGGSNFANTVIGYTNTSLGNLTPGAYIGYHMPSNVATYGASLTNQTRAAATYYFLKNDDSAAQAQIGSLRSYSEFNYTNTVTSGAVTIDKTNAQVQQVNLTGNVTSLTYSNFVSSASDGTNTDEQADTVTIIFNQGATGGYSVTFPSGSAYKYAGGTNTLSATTANSVTLVAITAIRISGTTTYLTTISPAFT